MEVLKTWRASSFPFKQFVLHHFHSSFRPSAITRSRIIFAQQQQQQRGRRSKSTISTNTSDREAVRAIRIKKVEELRSRGYEPYAYSWERTHTAAQLQDVYKDLENGEMRAEDSVSAAGRITGRRAFGKLVFLTLSDDTGNIQLYFEKESLPADQFEQLKKFIDLSDIIGASGSIKRTEKGELSVFVKFFTILTKSLLPLPDKFHGLTDDNKRYRHR
ncbi:hypothetical protein QJS04_geneDACA004429 [Acorus gramineus]|uniref:lysine--tRNA ligase n=1 Tax=Acorus gramineus TaxID=55184 RepID=A0AAV9B4Q7_ACOGR|nr:hypothetical protein QJS04_geneDACA004429 [Acorus gramineus]